jgi:glutathione S-transferase
VHALVAYALPVVVALLAWGAGAALVATLVVALAGMTVRLAVARRSVPAEGPALRLHSISFSHYAEKVRWCLDRLGVPYVETPDVGVLGILVAGRSVPTLDVSPGGTRIGDSPRILRYLWGEYAARLPDGRADFLGPTAERLELESYFDRRLGNDVRVWVYAKVFERRDLTLRAWGIEDTRIPRWQRTLLPFVAPLLRFAVRRMLGVTPERAARTLEKTRETFDRVDALLADGRRYLTGDTLSYADITFASLAGLAVLPPEYPGPALPGRRLVVEELDAAWRAEVEAFRARPSGQFVLRLYREERSPAGTR